ncbi:acyl-CoA carboxylase subunit epsilon [Allosalinactinospora lopnorensis]|uniref:acyl-CoA carboxylase subunit epsilon n=1 Tax=Allosalinactinospora lopnorensis TaxID=1352348 RepID=UPI000623DBAA|nr:acyl-CoA carboxylase subunit epsilon [Allosalinactinospora lopnorensis]
MSAPPTASGPQQRTAGHLRVVRGSPTSEEVAALVAVLTARARAAQAARESAASRRAPGSTWRDRSRLMRRPLQSGPSAWRASFRPG